MARRFLGDEQRHTVLWDQYIIYNSFNKLFCGQEMFCRMTPILLLLRAPS